jgi:hypothetical protein
LLEPFQEECAGARVLMEKTNARTATAKPTVPAILTSGDFFCMVVLLIFRFPE